MFQKWLNKKEAVSKEVKEMKVTSSYLSYPNIQSVVGPALEHLSFETVFNKNIMDEIELIIDEL